MTKVPNFSVLIGICGLLIVAQLYWTYVTWQFVRHEQDIEKECKKHNPYDFVVKWYNFSNIAALVWMVCMIVLILVSLARKK